MLNSDDVILLSVDVVSLIGNDDIVISLICDVDVISSTNDIDGVTLLIDDKVTLFIPIDDDDNIS